MMTITEKDLVTIIIEEINTMKFHHTKLIDVRRCYLFFHLFMITAVLLLGKTAVCLAGFSEIPLTVRIEIENGTNEEVIIFRCRHQQLDAVIGWRLNGLPIDNFDDITDDSTRESNSTLVYTLTIPARSEYNGTEVVCVALFTDGSPAESTPPAVLFITEVITTLASTTTESTLVPTTTFSVHDFQIVPTPLNVSVEQVTAKFQCQNQFVDGISWRVNGTSVNLLNLPNISSESMQDGRGTVFLLSIGALLRYNQSSIECDAVLFDRPPGLPIRTPPVMLLIQDIPGRVNNAALERNYTSQSLTITWDPLPTLDLTNVDPDIVYSLELFMITCGHNVLISQRSIAEKSATEEGLDLMQIYKVVIAARNNVREARNGPSVEIRETFMLLEVLTLFQLAKNSQVNITSYDPVSLYYTMILESIDDSGQDLEINITVERDEEMINMSIDERLPSKSLWRISVLAYGCEADTVVNGAVLSTHLIQNISVNSPQSGAIRVTGLVVDEIITIGVLIIIYSLTDDGDVQYVAQNTSQIFDITVEGLSGTEYGVSVFSLEDGMPFSRVVTFPSLLHFVRNEFQEEVQQSPSGLAIEYQLHPTSTGVCITCTFMDISTTDCVVVVHQRISHLSSSGLMNIESSHKFNRSGDTAYGCIEQLSLVEYQIGVIGGNEIQSKKHIEPSICDVTCITLSSSLTAILLALVLSLLLAITYFTRQHHKSVNLSSTDDDLELHKCNAYEVVKLSHHRVVMETNPAYGEVGQFSS